MVFAMVFAMPFAMAWCVVLAPPTYAEPFDPTRPPASLQAIVHADRADAPVPLVLRSVLVSAERKLAIINDRRVVPGDRVGDAQVLSIASASVQLRGPRGEYTLRLSTPVKQPVRPE